jgi:hypothetical protein
MSLTAHSLIVLPNFSDVFSCIRQFSDFDQALEWIDETKKQGSFNGSDFLAAHTQPENSESINAAISIERLPFLSRILVYRYLLHQTLLFSQKGFNKPHHEALIDLLISQIAGCIGTQKIFHILNWYFEKPSMKALKLYLLSHLAVFAENENAAAKTVVYRNYLQEAQEAEHEEHLAKAVEMSVAQYLKTDPETAEYLLDEGIQVLSSDRWIELIGLIALKYCEQGQHQKALPLLSVLYEILHRGRWPEPAAVFRNVFFYILQYGSLLLDAGDFGKARAVYSYLSSTLLLSRQRFMEEEGQEDWLHQFYLACFEIQTGLYSACAELGDSMGAEDAVKELRHISDASGYDFNEQFERFLEKHQMQAD